MAQIPELPGCVADGATVEEAIQNLDVVAQEWIETAKQLGREVPEPMDLAKFNRRQKEAAEQEKAAKGALKHPATNLVESTNARSRASALFDFSTEESE